MSDTEHSSFLNALEQSNQGPSPAEKRILERCRDIAIGALSGALKGTLEKLTDEFFMLAEKSVQIDVQHLYLEAMTLARDRHELIEQNFRTQFIRGFDQAVHADAAQKKQSLADENGEFGLVAPDDLEESIARQEMAAKMKGNCRDELFALDRRMGALLHDAELQQHTNPLGPDVLSTAFMEACRETQAGLKVRLLFVTMWDKHMQNGVLSTYHEVNQYLVEKNILPKIKREIKRQGAANAVQVAAAAAQAAVQAMGFEDEGAEVFETMQHLFHAAAARGTLPGMAMGMPGGFYAGAQGMPGYAGGGPGLAAQGGAGVGGFVGMPGLVGNPGVNGIPGAQVYANGQEANALGENAQGFMPAAGMVMAHNPVVVTHLTQLQHGDVAALGAAPIDAGTLIAGNVSMLRELKNTDLAASLGSVDAMTIDIVAMLFDFIFEDKQVPDPIKALIGRLQIPVLKAAMLDQAFFSKKSHPTRRLLNALADAATGWEEAITHDSPLYLKVDQIVQRVNDEFEDNLAVFERALDDFERFIEEQEHVADALVEVSIDMLQAREREQIKEEDAQQAAESAVAARAADSEVPEAVRLFLCQEWVKPLRAAYLTGGTESAAWLESLGLMDDLIWSVRPKLTRESRQYMVKTLPGLLRRLQEGMARAEIPATVREQFMSRLVHCHAAAVKAGFNLQAEPPMVTEASWDEAVRAHPQPSASETNETAVVLPFVRPEVKDKNEVKLEILRAAEQDKNLEVEEITIASVGWIEKDELHAEDACPVEDEFAQENLLDEAAAKHLVAELKPGTWVEFRHTGEETMQAKLKWISPLKSAYLFTDRQGKRAATMPQAKLEAAFRIGSARILDDLPLLDRAVDNVIEALKQAAA